MTFSVKELDKEIQPKDLDLILKDASDEFGYIPEELPNVLLYDQVHTLLKLYEREGKEAMGLTNEGYTSLRVKLRKKFGPIKIPMMEIAYYSRPRENSPNTLNLLVATFSDMFPFSFYPGIASRDVAQSFLNNVSQRVNDYHL